MKLVMPKNDGLVKPWYYDVYYGYIRRWADFVGATITLVSSGDKVWCGGRERHVFSVLLDGQQILFDFSNHKPFQADPDKYSAPYFKFHYSYDYPEHAKHPNVFPMTPQMMFDWHDFAILRESVVYSAKGQLILSNQRPRAAAARRRTIAQKMLKDSFGDRVSTEFMDRNKWLRLHSDCLCAVAIPGARPDILDKGHVEQMGLGVCVVSPPITIVLPWYKRLEPWVHYVPIRYDFTDLIDRVRWCDQNRNECITIGRNAKRLFDEVCHPVQVWKWVRECVDKWRATNENTNRR